MNKDIENSPSLCLSRKIRYTKMEREQKKEMRNKQDSRIRATLKIILFHCLDFGPTFHVNAGFQAYSRIYADFKHLNENNLQIE